MLGIQVQDQYAIQITSEWDNSSAQGAENLEEQAALISNLSTLYGKHETAFHVSLDRSVFGPGGLAQAPVVEYVQTWFPTSQVTPDFHRKIESDFSRFDAVYLEGATGHLGLATGWVLEELGHEKITGGEKARCFFVMRGWESMDAFQRAVQHEKYKESIPILFAWEAPFFEMVGVGLCWMK